MATSVSLDVKVVTVPIYCEYFDWCLFQTVPAGSLILDGHAVYLGF